MQNSLPSMIVRMRASATTQSCRTLGGRFTGGIVDRGL
jgi:hypothetical protein